MSAVETEQTPPHVRGRQFRCPDCGADSAFDAASGRLRCGHCGATREVPAGDGEILEYDLRSGLADVPRGWGAATRTSGCTECGAKVVFSDGTRATRCTFCGSAKVLDRTEATQPIQPESLVPFAVDHAAAQSAFAKWRRRLWFRPSALARVARLDELAGVYVPFWTFDARVDSSWTAEAGYHYYETETFYEDENGETVAKTRQVQRTRWEPAWGSRTDVYDDLLVCASRGVPPKLAAKLHTFDTERLVPWSAAFLAGWRAEEYAIELPEAAGVATQRMREEQHRRCARDVPGDEQRFLAVDDRFSEQTFKHILLPIWIAAYRFRDRIYHVAINGQTGEVSGEAPWSVAKFALLISAIAALIAIAWMTLGQ